MNATRQAYLPGRRARPSMAPSRGAAKPKEKPLPRKPPPKRPPDRRKPGRKDPERPRRKEPQPRKPKELPRKPYRRPDKRPLFPPQKKPDTPFGKRKQFPTFTKNNRWYVPRLGRLLPWLPIIEGAYLWYLGSPERANPADYGFKLVCESSPPPWQVVAHTPGPAGNVCGVGLQVVGVPGPGNDPNNFVIPAGGWSSGSHYDSLYYSWPNPAVPGRGTHIEIWTRDNWHEPEFVSRPDREFPEGRPEPKVQPLPYDPWPWPDHPTDWPLPPLNPPLPRGRPDPRHPEDPLPDSYFPEEPLTPGPDIPGIETTPDQPDIVTDHEKRPPDDKEKEKKKQLKPTVATSWLKYLADKGMKYTELDDFFSAIYKGLHWKVRRWRGRDGVWRDRDITSWDRAERIYREIGSLNINDAIHNLSTQELIDIGLGKTSQKTIDNFKKSGFQFPQGLTSTRYTKTWKEVYEQKLKEQGSRVGHRYIYTNDYDPVTKTWTRNKRLHTDKTTIPWYRQTSDWKRRARRGESEYWELPENRKQDKVISRNYYQSRHTWRPWDLRKGTKL